MEKKDIFYAWRWPKTINIRYINARTNIIFCKFNIKRLMNLVSIFKVLIKTYEIAYHGVKNLIILNDDKKQFKLNNKFIISEKAWRLSTNYNYFYRLINFYWNNRK